MRVLFVIHTPKDPETAVFAHVEERAKYLHACGDTASVLGPDDFAFLRGRGTRWRLLAYPVAVGLRLWRCRREWDIAVLHSYAGWAFNLVRGRTLGWTRVVTQFHGLEPLAFAAANEQARRSTQRLSLRYRLFHGRVMPLILSMSCRKSDAVFCLNGAEREFLIENQWAPEERIRVVNNGVPEWFFVERRHREQVRRLLFVGQWGAAKGVHYLAEGFATLVERHPGLKLWCVGTRVPASRVRAAFPPHVARQVFVRPTVRHRAIPGYLRATDIFVFPSLSEGASVALLEAAASGLPIVTTPVGAAPEYLENGESAIFMRPASADELCAGVERLLLSFETRKRLGSRASAAASAYRQERVFAALRDELSSVVGST